MKSTIYIKLFIGVLLFATLVALTVFNVPNSQRLVDLIYMALVGLGITHLDGKGADPNRAPVDKEAGFARLGMLGLVASIALGAMLLTGCGTTSQGQVTTQTAQVTYTQACASYSGVFATVIAARKAGKLNQVQKDQITLISSEITPLCTGALPVDTDTATQQIMAAVASLTLVEVALKAN